MSVASGSADLNTWDFTGSGSTPAFSYGNTLEFTSNQGLGVTASAYSTGLVVLNNPLSTPLNKAYLGSYSLGLGVSASPFDLSHTVDNFGHVDFVVFQFDEVVKATSLTLSAFGDTDLRIWAGTLASSFDFTGKTANQLDGLLTSYGVSSGGTTSRTATIPDPVLGNYLVVAANPQRFDWNDSFKIAQLQGTFEAVAVPGPIAGAGLPALLLLSGWGLFTCRTRPAFQRI